MWPQLLMGAAGVATGAAGLAMGSGQPTGYSKGDIEHLVGTRNTQIGEFAKQLAQIRARYATELQSFGNNTYNRFMPIAQAQLGAQGKQVNGGAFSSVLARKAAEIQDEGMLRNLEMERGDANTVDSAYGNTFGAQLGANISGPTANPGSRFLGQLSSGFLSAGLNGMSGGKKKSIFGTGSPTTAHGTEWGDLD